MVNIEREFILDPTCFLYLPLWKRDGWAFQTEDKNGSLVSVTGAVWTPEGREFDNADDELEILIPCPSEVTLLIWAIALSAGTATPWNDIAVRTLDVLALRMRNLSTDGNPSWSTKTAAGYDNINFDADASKWNLYGGYASDGYKECFLNGEFVGSDTSDFDYAGNTGFALYSATHEPQKKVGMMACFNRRLTRLEHRAIFNMTKWRWA